MIVVSVEQRHHPTVAMYNLCLCYYGLRGDTGASVRTWGNASVHPVRRYYQHQTTQQDYGHIQDNKGDRQE